MQIGIIGISSLNIDIAFKASQVGFKVIINNPKGNNIIRDCVEKMGVNVQLGSLLEAASAEIILLFLPKEDLEDILEKLPEMSGKIVLHTSGLIFNPQSNLSKITKAMTYKITASRLPSAHVIKLFNPAPNKSDYLHLVRREKEEIFFIADHSESRNNIILFFKKLQFQPIDLSNRLHLQNSWIKSLSPNRIRPNPWKTILTKNDTLLKSTTGASADIEVRELPKNS